MVSISREMCSSPIKAVKEHPVYATSLALAAVGLIGILVMGYLNRYHMIRPVGSWSASAIDKNVSLLSAGICITGCFIFMIKYFIDSVEKRSKEGER